MMKHILALQVAFIFGLGLSAQAQDHQSERIKLSFCAAKISGGLRLLHLPSPKSSGGGDLEWAEVRLNTHTASETIEYRGKREVVFYDSDKEGAQSVAKVTLRGDAKSYILVFIPKTKVTGYNVMAIPDRKFQFGTYYFHNFSSNRVAVQLGNKTKVIDKNKAANIVAAKNGQSEIVLIRAQFGKKARALKQTKWQLQPNQRELVIFYNHPSGNRLSMKHIVSIKPMTKS